MQNSLLAGFIPTAVCLEITHVKYFGLSGYDFEIS